MRADASRRAEGVALVVVSGASFGVFPIFVRTATDSGADTVAVLACRFAIAGAILVAVMVRSGRPWPRGRELAALVALGAVGYVGQSFAYVTALSLASAGLVALLLYLYPAIVTVLDAVVHGRRIDGVTAVALVLALGGSALVIGPSGSGRPAGIALGIAAAVIYSVYIVSGARVTATAGAIPSTTVIVLAATVVYTVAAAVGRPALPGTGTGWAAVVGIALVSTVLAITTFFAGLERLGPPDTATLSTVEPVVTVALAAAVLDESIGPAQLLGGVLILVAVAALARRRPAAAGGNRTTTEPVAPPMPSASPPSP